MFTGQNHGDAFDGAFAGRIVADFSDNPNGSVCTVSVRAWRGKLANNLVDGTMDGRAGGCGYCKFSAAFDSAVRNNIKAQGIAMPDLHGAGESSVRSFVESLGYQVIEVI
jgi:hypothetical protein